MSKRLLPYDKKLIIRYLLLLSGMAVLLKLSSGLGFAIIFPMMIWAMMSKNSIRLVFVLMAMIAMTIGNSNIMPKSGAFGLMLRSAMVLLSIVMTVQIAGRKNSPLLTPFLLMLLYVGYMIIPSAVGWCPPISFLKLFLFTVVFLGYYGVLNRVMENRTTSSEQLRSVFLSVATFFIFGSVVLIPFGIGQMGYDAVREALKSGGQVTSLFMGMTSHSQMMGPLASVYGVMIFADFIFSVRRKDALYIALILCVPILIWKTSSRTAMGSFLAGISFAVFFFMKARNIKSNWRSKILSTVIMVFTLLAIVVAAVPSARKSALQFVRKFGDADVQGVTLADITASRAGKWEESLRNFHAKPEIGNGFQVSEGMRGLKIRSLSDLITAPVEKGTWVVAILEEGGIFGMFIFCIFIIVAMIQLLRRHAYIGASVFFTALVINLGEFTIFSMTAIGGFLWSSVFIGLALDSQRFADQQRERMLPTQLCMYR